MNPAPPFASSWATGRITATMYDPGGLPLTPAASMLPRTVTSQDGKTPGNVPAGAGVGGASASASPVMGWPRAFTSGWLIGRVACAGRALSKTGADWVESNNWAQVRAWAGIWITELSGTIVMMLLMVSVPPAFAAPPGFRVAAWMNPVISNLAGTLLLSTVN